MGFKLDGFDDMRRKLDTLRRRANNLSGPVAFEDLFPPEFMRRYTDCKTIDELFSGFSVESQEDFEKLDVAELDKVVQEKTRFTSWDSMPARSKWSAASTSGTSEAHDQPMPSDVLRREDWPGHPVDLSEGFRPRKNQEAAW